MRITRIVTSVIEIVEEEPAPMSIRQEWPAPVRLPSRPVIPGSNGAPALGPGVLSSKGGPSSTVAVGAAVVGAASAAAALLSNDQVRRRVAVGAARARTALHAVHVEASRRVAALRGTQRTPRALPPAAIPVSVPTAPTGPEQPAPGAMA